MPIETMPFEQSDLVVDLRAHDGLCNLNAFGIVVCLVLFYPGLYMRARCQGQHHAQGPSGVRGHHKVDVVDGAPEHG